MDGRGAAVDSRIPSVANIADTGLWRLRESNALEKGEYQSVPILVDIANSDTVPS